MKKAGDPSEDSDSDSSIESEPEVGSKRRGRPRGRGKSRGTTRRRQQRVSNRRGWFRVKICDTVQEIVEEEGYCPRRVFGARQMHLDWKAQPMKWCFNTKKMNHPSMLIPSPPDILTLFICANVEGDLLLPPLIVDSNPPSPKVQAADPSMMWETHSEASVTTHVFSKWLKIHFAPAVFEYCRKNKLEEKVLLVVHPRLIDPLLPPPPTGVKVTRMVSNHTHPFEHGVTTAIQSQFNMNIMTHYFKLQFQKESEEVLRNYLMGCDLEKAIMNLSHIWKYYRQRLLQEAWKKDWPEGVPPAPPKRPKSANKNAAHQKKKLKPNSTLRERLLTISQSDPLPLSHADTYIASNTPHTSTATTSHATGSQLDPLSLSLHTAKPDSLSSAPHTSTSSATDSQLDPLSLSLHTSTNSASHTAELDSLSPTPHASTHSCNNPEIPTDPLSQVPNVEPRISSLMPVSSSQIPEKVERLLMKASRLALERDPDLGRSTRLCLGVVKALMAWTDQLQTPLHL